MCVFVCVVVGGLLSAHLLARRAGMELEPGWPCSGPLLRMAEDAARKLLPGEDVNHFTHTHYLVVIFRHSQSHTKLSHDCSIPDRHWHAVRNGEPSEGCQRH